MTLQRDPIPATVALATQDPSPRCGSNTSPGGRSHPAAPTVDTFTTYVLALPELLIRHQSLWPGSPQWSLLSHVLPHSRAVLVTLDRLYLLLDEPLPTSLEPRPPRPDTREAVVGSAWPPVFIQGSLDWGCLS